MICERPISPAAYLYVSVTTDGPVIAQHPEPCRGTSIQGLVPTSTWLHQTAVTVGASQGPSQCIFYFSNRPFQSLTAPVVASPRSRPQTPQSKPPTMTLVASPPEISQQVTVPPYAQTGV